MTMKHVNIKEKKVTISTGTTAAIVTQAFTPVTTATANDVNTPSCNSNATPRSINGIIYDSLLGLEDKRHNNDKEAENENHLSISVSQQFTANPQPSTSGCSAFFLAQQSQLAVNQVIDEASFATPEQQELDTIGACRYCGCNSQITNLSCHKCRYHFNSTEPHCTVKCNLNHLVKDCDCQSSCNYKSKNEWLHKHLMKTSVNLHSAVCARRQKIIDYKNCTCYRVNSGTVPSAVRKDEGGFFRNLWRCLSSISLKKSGNLSRNHSENNSESASSSEKLEDGLFDKKKSRAVGGSCECLNCSCETAGCDLYVGTDACGREKSKVKLGCSSLEVSQLCPTCSHCYGDSACEYASSGRNTCLKMNKSTDKKHQTCLSYEIPDCIEFDPVKEQTTIWSPKVWSLTQELFRLSKFGWYWGPISRNEAEEKLTDQPDGAFLVRDSSDERYLLSLSFRSYGRTLHTRIEHCNGMFSFYAQPDTEGYSSIVDLIEHSMKDSPASVFYYSRSRSDTAPQFPVCLRKPVSRYTQVRSLQYLCRFVIRQHTRFDHIQQLPLPTALKGWIEENQY